MSLRTLAMQNYKPANADKDIEPDDMESFVESITNIKTTSDSHQAYSKGS